METYEAVLFDLDGTLTESGEGITKSVQYALEKMGIHTTDLASLRCFIGPPLIESFMNYGALDRKTAEKALQYYRERFTTKGIYENALYPGIRDLLKKLKTEGKRLAIASSKPEPFVLQIADYFEMIQFFDVITGSTMDEKRTDKTEVIEETLKRLGLEKHRDSAVMVGDKEHDVIGARNAGIRCIGVLYGYGSREEIESAEPDRIAETVSELEKILICR